MADTTCWSILLLVLLTFYPPFLQAENVAYLKSTYQHGTLGGHRAELAVDGNRNQDGRNGDCAVSNSYDPGLGQGFEPAWWAVDLGTPDVNELFFIQRVRIYNRRDGFTDSIRGSIIKVGTFKDVKTQTECARIDTADHLVQKLCNPTSPVRYLSIVSNSEASLHLCEVEVEGYSNKVFQKRFPAPTIREVRSGGVVLLQIMPPQEPVNSYQVLYTALSGDTREQYGNKTSQAQGYFIEQRYLFPGTQYSIHVLGIIQEGAMEKATMISNKLMVQTPLDREIPRIWFPPQEISVHPDSVQIKFQHMTQSWYYQIEVMSSATYVQPKLVHWVPGKTEYIETINGLQPSTDYAVYVVPYSQLGGVAVRGIQSPSLVFQTLNAGVPGIPLTTQPTTPGFIRSSPWGPFPPTTMGPRISTNGLRVSTFIPPATVFTIKTTTTLAVLMNCTTGSEGPLCSAAVSSDKSWVLPTAAGVAGGVVLLAIALIIAVCIRRRRKKADDGGETALNRQSNTYVDDEGMHPQYYTSTLPTSSEANTISELGSKRNSAATVTESRTSKASGTSRTSRTSGTSGQEIEPPEPSEPIEDEDKLHEDIDTLYAKINKGASTYGSQNGIHSNSAMR